MHALPQRVADLTGARRGPTVSDYQTPAQG